MLGWSHQVCCSSGSHVSCGFSGDDWDFLFFRGTVAGSDRGLFTPHNEHWSTIPILMYRAIFAMVGPRHYLPTPFR